MKRYIAEDWRFQLLLNSSQKSKRDILIVEDDADLREVVSSILLNEGYGVRTAANGVEALEDLRVRSRPCMVLLDLMMPVMDGWQLLETLRADQSLPDVSVIVTSAAPSGDLSGVTHVLRKPYSLDGLLSLVKEHCQTFAA